MQLYAKHCTGSENLVARNPYKELSENQFMNIFRVSKALYLFLVAVLSPYLKKSCSSKDIDVNLKVLVALKFFATGSYQTDLANNWFLGISQASVSRCIEEVTSALNHPLIFNRFIKFPASYEELNNLRANFYRKFAFPGVVGCIDCTHVAIVPPEAKHPEYPEHIYVNRKGYHSINVQLVCDDNLKILNINAKYPGSSHDSFIWKNSKLNALMRSIHDQGHNDYFLIGDSGYPLRPWMMVPFNNPIPNTPEWRYNKKHGTVRTLIEHCNGVLKMRFRCCLKHRVLHYKPEKACRMINACAVLHNLCIMHNIPEPTEEMEFGDLGMIAPVQDNEEIIGQVNSELLEGRRTRSRIVQTAFS